MPALGLTQADQANLNSWSYRWEADLYIPTNYVLDREMKVVSADAGVMNPEPWLQ